MFRRPHSGRRAGNGVARGRWCEKVVLGPRRASAGGYRSGVLGRTGRTSETSRPRGRPWTSKSLVCHLSLLFRPPPPTPPTPFATPFCQATQARTSSSARGAKTGSSGAPEPRLFRQDGRLRIVSSAQCGSTTETRRDLAVRTSRAVVLSVDPRAAGITQHHNVILALCKPATAVAITRTLHYPSHSSRRQR